MTFSAVGQTGTEIDADDEKKVNRAISIVIGFCLVSACCFDARACQHQKRNDYAYRCPGRTC